MHLAAILQRTPTDASSAPKDHPTATHYTNIPDLLADSSLDLIIITTAPDSHYDLCTQILNANKHVLCEKPFVPTSKQASELKELAHSKGKLICIYQNRRWDADFLTLQNLIKEDKLGRIVEYHTNFDRQKAERATNWKGELPMSQAGGVLYDLGSHMIDQAYTLFGMPTSVNGFWNIERDDPRKGEEPDAFTAVLRYGGKGAMLVFVKASVISVLETQPRFLVKGTKGSYEKRGLDCQEDQLRNGGMKPTDKGYGVEDESKAGSLTLLGTDGAIKKEVCKNMTAGAYPVFYEELAKSLQSGKEEDVPVKAGEVVDVLRILEAVKESAETGRSINF